MTVEDDAQRRALLADFGVTVTRVLGGTFTAALSEDDGLNLDAGENTDGIVQLLAVSADVAATSLAEHESVTVGGVTYTVDKIDGLSDGMDVIHLGVT